MRLIVNEEDSSMMCHGDDENYEVVRNKIVDQRRWTTTHEVIIKDKNSGKYYQAEYSVGSTEYQDGCNSYPKEWDEVEPYEKTVTEYRPVGEKI